MAKVRTARKAKDPRGDGPFVSAAFICEKVLSEDDVISAIRIVDRFEIPTPPARLSEGPVEDRPIVRLNGMIVVIIKSGAFQGECEVLLQCKTPSGSTGPIGRATGKLDGGPHGLNTRLPVAFPYDGPGVYWYDIEVNGQFLTSVPMELAVKESKGAPAPTKPKAKGKE